MRGPIKLKKKINVLFFLEPDKVESEALVDQLTPKCSQKNTEDKEVCWGFGHVIPSLHEQSGRIPGHRQTQGQQGRGRCPDQTNNRDVMSNQEGKGAFSKQASWRRDNWGGPSGGDQSDPLLGGRLQSYCDT